MLKKVSVWFLVIILITSLFINFHQYGQIRSFKDKQNSIDKETKAQIQTLVNYLEEIDKLDKNTLEGQMNLTYLSLAFSSYKRNEIVSDAFYKLQLLIHSNENLSTDEIRQINSILKKIIKPEKSIIDIEACKELDNYILSTFLR
ncbi:hypothetical protein [Desnuesiella massiliensis]|uniref:hypothetical protein n=1 Tax=Desnuesiella massiliensis TaxID=1650662 RepID=UPI0006E42484|nr:hypothetical protein [Desnuesiella massiliensis]